MANKNWLSFQPYVGGSECATMPADIPWTEYQNLISQGYTPTQIQIAYGNGGGGVGLGAAPAGGENVPYGTFWNPLHPTFWNVPENPASPVAQQAAAAGGVLPTPTPPVEDVADMSPYFEAGEMLTAPMSEYEQQALTMLSDLVEKLGGMGSPHETPMGENVGAALTQLLSGEFPEAYFQESIAGPSRKTFEELTAPALREEFVEPGTYWGTDRMKTVAKGRTDMESMLSAIRGDLGYKAQQMALQSLGPGMEYMGLPAKQLIQQIAGTSGYMGAAALPRLIEQHGLDIAYQEFIRTRPENQPYAQMLLSMLGIPMMASYAPEAPESPLAPIAQIFGSLIPLLAG